jgi:hypothetical protein
MRAGFRGGLHKRKCVRQHCVIKGREGSGDVRDARSGLDGAVNWKTAGPVRATAMPCGMSGVETSYPACEYFGPVLFCDEIGYDAPWHRWTPALPKPCRSASGSARPSAACNTGRREGNAYDAGKGRGEEHLLARVRVGRVAQDTGQVLDDRLERPRREHVGDRVAALIDDQAENSFDQSCSLEEEITWEARPHLVGRPVNRVLGPGHALVVGQRSEALERVVHRVEAR